MTENETKEILAIHYEFLRESWKPYPDRKVLDALRIAISSIDKIQQYRAIGTVEEIKEILQIISEGQDDVDESGISTGLLHTLLEYTEYKKIGTVEECREARERQRGKKPNITTGKTEEDKLACCPICEGNLDWTYNGFWRKGNPKYCSNCGQSIDWSDTP